MAFLQLLLTVTVLGVEQLLKIRYGALGLTFLVLFSIGVRTRNTTFLSASAVVFLLLMAQA
ncbi:hypothetical protein OG920_20995 [Streptomyces europaeiscabiei]|uniref:hypothetical protein n=1 Tax=Streptomyces TaxID=1883 RepID=UPI000A3A4DDE|nr:MULTISPECIES: hypothetical protein [Streptomyces]MDX3584516.1 hypothetical protein [Streptomyces europaeiscabiei]MDX3618490.1 hypothetical protein [Streptomyces europaeiscabiei]MDX3635795.1 hypothetical protein [Streptomyces europaeiscabiei]MDX3653230.1 hypothetical protein [Streptomyces europaeiscabiei]WUD33668.1 hypothetical protein OG858_21130 [Streptomyces europaeiscabiei]